MKRTRKGRFMAAPVADTAPLLHDTEIARAGRVLGLAAAAKRRAVQSAQRWAHIKALRESMGLYD